MSKGIPREVLEELNILKKEKVEDEFEVTAIVERHQIKLPVPAKIRQELDFKKGKKLKVKFNPKNKSITYKY